MKIKVFKYTICNAASHPCKGDLETEWGREKLKELSTPEQIEDEINAFIESVYKVIDVKVNQIEEHWHNNGRGNTISLVYTIMYSERGKMEVRREGILFQREKER